MATKIIFNDFEDREDEIEAFERHSWFINQLSDYLDEVVIDGWCEIYLKFKEGSYGKEDLKKVAVAIGEVCPDEADEENGYVRLWWD